jgi:cysteine synthase A
VRQKESGSVVTLLCDSGERYRSTHYDDAWLECRGIDIKAAEDAMEEFFETGILGAPGEAVYRSQPASS